MPVQSMTRALCAGEIPDDRAFDDAMPFELRAVSRQYWTPLSVAVRTAGWLQELGVRTVVDIGSGAGKFCVAASLASGCELIGIEQRLHLIRAARELARCFGVHDRVRFLHGTFSRIPIPLADAYYLFNPFGDNLSGYGSGLGDDVELGTARYAREVACAQRYFSHAPVGTCVITYNGFGGRMPAGYREVRVDRELPCVLRAWRKVSPTSTAVTALRADPESRG